MQITSVGYWQNGKELWFCKQVGDLPILKTCHFIQEDGLDGMWGAWYFLYQMPHKGWKKLRANARFKMKNGKVVNLKTIGPPWAPWSDE